MQKGPSLQGARLLPPSSLLPLRPPRAFVPLQDGWVAGPMGRGRVAKRASQAPRPSDRAVTLIRSCRMLRIPSDCFSPARAPHHCLGALPPLRDFPIAASTQENGNSDARKAGRVREAVGYWQGHKFSGPNDRMSQPTRTGRQLKHPEIPWATLPIATSATGWRMYLQTAHIGNCSKFPRNASPTTPVAAGLQTPLNQGKGVVVRE